jgi:hypothetical protein
MSHGHGCDAGGHSYASDGLGASGSAEGPGYTVEGNVPVANIKRVMVNGAPISEPSHEFVIRQTKGG